jgi:hypothetical protein
MPFKKGHKFYKGGEKGWFKKGQIPYYLGKKMSLESREKMRLAKLKNPTRYWLGKKRDVETINKIIKKKKGIHNKKLSGANSYFWKGGVTPINKVIRMSLETKLWREAVFIRDNWTCQSCKAKGGKLQAHHIKSFSQYPELRFSIDNGITLCVNCHKFTDNYGGKSNKKEIKGK